MLKIPDFNKGFFYISLIYVIGLLGILIPYSRSLFLSLTPLNLFVSFAFILIYENSNIDLRRIFLIFSIILFAWLIEFAGVNTGFIFGQYKYGTTLGLKFLNTPLIIGINWFILIAGSASIVNKFNWSPVFKVLIASGLMTILDILIEQVATKTDMWSWTSGEIPLQNYFAWFVISILIHSFWMFTGNTKVNPMAVRIFWIQYLFFGLLTLYFNLFQ